MNLYKKFDVRYSLKGDVYKVNSICSSSGVLNFIVPGFTSDDEIEQLLQSHFTIYLEDIHSGFPSYLVYEKALNSPAAFHARFRDMKFEEFSLLQTLIMTGGFAPPWKRESLRFQVEKLPKKINLPEYATMDFSSRPVLFQVKDFNGQGLRITGQGLNPPLAPGELVDLDLLGRSGDIIPGCKARVMRLSVTRLGFKKSSLNYEAGLKIVDFSEKGRRLYETILMDCQGINSQNGEDIFFMKSGDQ